MNERKDEESENSVPTDHSDQLLIYGGYLKKWTNYYNGWQDRYVILTNGRLSYFKDKDDTDISCKGSLNVTKVKIIVNTYDECRFDVKAGKSIYYFRADTAVERNQWIFQIETIKETISIGTNQDSDNLSRVNSIASLLSDSSQKSFGATGEDVINLSECLEELEVFKNQIYNHIETIQNVYDVFSGTFGKPEVGIDLNTSDDDEDDSLTVNNVLSRLFFNKPKSKTTKSLKKNSTNQNQLFMTPQSPTSSTLNQDQTSSDRRVTPQKNCTCCKQLEKVHALKVDFVSQALGFRSAASGLLATMSDCIETINSAHDCYRESLKKERYKKHTLGEKYKHLRLKGKDLSVLQNGPDFVEGPHSMIESDEFFDAFETAYEIETGRIKLEMDRVNAQLHSIRSDTSLHKVSVTTEHPQKDERYAAQTIKEFEEAEQFLTEPMGNDGTWEISSENGPTRIYKKTLEIGDIVVDPHRVISIYEGVTAEEVAIYFWDPSLRLGWDVNVDEINVLEWLDDNSCIVHQLHKHIWPAARRDCCFYSEIRCINNTTKLGESLLNIMTEENTKKNLSTNATMVGPSWMVVNFSVDYPNAMGENCVRALANVGLLCQTFSRKPSNTDPNTLKREDIFTRLHYFASINPGGWLPAGAVRSVARREFPKFIQNLGNNIRNNVLANTFHFNV